MFQLPDYYSRNSAQGYDGLNESLSVAQFEIGTAKNFVYFIFDWGQKKFWITDPHAGVLKPLELAQQKGLSFSGILLTHTHWDHTNGIEEILTHFQHTEVSLYVHRDDFFRLEKKASTTLKNIWLKDQEVFIHSPTLSVTSLYTPGHSQGECCFLVKNSTHQLLLTGDTLFIQDCGRTDLETGSDSELYESLQKIKTLSPEVIILPGHHYRTQCASILKDEITTNPALKAKTIEELKNLP